jgi:aryl-alcohol dehydrogenase-like predicted oxidoreductase
MTMKKKIGKSGIAVEPLCFGGNVLGWTADEQRSFELLDAFSGEGFNFIDTANMYSNWAPGNSGGESERVLGKWMKSRGNRNKIILATKVGGPETDGGKGLSKAYILKSAEASLKRLQTDYIDLYQSHFDDPNTPQEETLEAYSELISQGKIRIIGASNFTSERLESALALSMKHNLPAYQLLQPQYNLCERSDFEKNLEPYCRKKNMGVICYFPLANGFLSGKYRHASDSAKSVRGDRMIKYLNPRGLAILKVLDDLAVQYNCKPASLALAWLLSKPTITAPIASATSVGQLRELMACREIKLNEASVALLDEASA